jgi:hypothetical protein
VSVHGLCVLSLGSLLVVCCLRFSLPM